MSTALVTASFVNTSDERKRVTQEILTEKQSAASKEISRQIKQGFDDAFMRGEQTGQFNRHRCIKCLADEPRKVYMDYEYSFCFDCYTKFRDDLEEDDLPDLEADPDIVEPITNEQKAEQWIEEVFYQPITTKPTRKYFKDVATPVLCITCQKMHNTFTASMTGSDVKCVDCTFGIKRR